LTGGKFDPESSKKKKIFLPPLDLYVTSWFIISLSGGIRVEYTVDKLARLGGVSARTLRYYDQIGLLRPARVSATGYRIYGEAEVDMLQQILFYRELGMALTAIAQIVKHKDFDRVAALCAHLRALENRQAQTERLIATLHKTIQKEMGMIRMTDKEKFDGFKEQMIQENEEKYGAEIREKYGDEAVRASNDKMRNLTQEQYDQWQALATEMQAKLESAVKSGAAPSGEAGREVTELHKAWLQFTLPQYSPAMHKGLGEMYVADERFTAHYDKNVKGCAAFLRDAIGRWAK
jgi:DNA-binding transcriptional MerR regulator